MVRFCLTIILTLTSIIVIHGDGLPDLLDYLHHDVAANNELLGVQSGIDTTPMLVDKAGNLVDDGTYVYSYDAWNRVIDVQQRGSVVFDGDGAMESGSPGGFVAGFAYDGLGRLIFKERPADETGFKPREHYYYDGVRRIQTIKRTPFFPLPDPDDPDTGVILEPPEGGGGGGGGGKGGPPIPQSPLPEWSVSLEREYVLGTDYVDEFILEYSSPGTPFYTLQDGNYNVVGIVDNSAAVRKQYTYSPYGRLIASESYGAALYTQHGFQGLFLHRYNAGTSNEMLIPDKDVLYLTPNRTYVPKLGRWLQKDPNATSLALLAVAAMNGSAAAASLDGFDVQSLYGDGLNLYQFTSSNPINRRDPVGLSSDFDYFDEANDIVADWAGERVAFMQELVDTAIGVAKAAGQIALESAIVAFVPGGAFFVSAYHAYSGGVNIYDNGLGWGNGLEFAAGFGGSVGPGIMKFLRRAGSSALATLSRYTGRGNRGAISTARNSFFYEKKIFDQMRARGWTDDMIDEATNNGEQVWAINRANGNPATRYIHPNTGQSVVIDNITEEVIHVGGPGFRYGPASGDLP